MNLPGPDDYIDIHTHDGTATDPGIFSVISLMAHEGKQPVNIKSVAYTFGIHPWFLTESTHDRQIEEVIEAAVNPSVIAIGEAGFDRIKGPAADLQSRTFEEQVRIAEEQNKPVVIHCVRAWDELMLAHKRLKPSKPWMVHGFRGNRKLAAQLISKNMFLSFWFDFIIRPEAAELIKSLPAERIFLETDGSGVDIKDIYRKVSTDLEVTVDKLKEIIYKNFIEYFNLKIINHGVTRDFTE
jgi:TatD DNase family protein